MDSRSSPLRVAIVEDQPLFRSMLASLLRTQAGVVVPVSEADTGSARRSIRPGEVDVALLDVELPDGNGFELGRELRRADPSLGIVLLSSQDVMEVLLNLPAGARAGWSYLSKTSGTSVTTLMRALRASADGRTLLDPDLVRDSVPRSGSPIEGLAPRQLAGLKLLATGMSNSAIAAELKISTHSVDNLLNSVYSALGLGPEPDRNRRVSAVLQLITGSSRSGRSVPGL